VYFAFSISACARCSVTIVVAGRDARVMASFVAVRAVMDFFDRSFFVDARFFMRRNVQERCRPVNAAIRG